LLKPTITPNSQEAQLPDDAFMVTKADKEGRITYVSRLFSEISAYREDELLAQPHSIIRHPDMPWGIYQLLWETLQAAQEFNGILKNLRKDGGYYWAFTNISASLSPTGDFLGYYSVHRKPSPRVIQALQSLYRQMLAAEANAASKEAAIAASRKILISRLEADGMDYDQFVLTL
jgi:aerotaxis receptor